MSVRQRARRWRTQGGHLVTEFALVSVFLVPLFLGTVSVGMNLTRSVQVTQVVRDAGLMYARLVDFSLDSNKAILERLAIGMDFHRDGTGKGVVILSKITYADDTDCDAAGLVGGECVNRGMYVITQRIVIGNGSLKESAFGTPNSGLIDSKGNIPLYLKETSARAQNFSSLVTLQSREFSYVAEGYFEGVAFKFGGWPMADNIYTRALF